ncbi:hypothetical protein KDW_30480 [Dictyobacter vulcani]|uniref:RNA polymerase sigma-70 region 2 domain-containing protein n=1 Tax=Dictyobacter vulcani TaxID=2607529 RepID=A0A5J4KUJ0_9CHLR|nr:sigma factor [Dictyobacter vulcani]GER88886.1 hypothetical protein KDW_30480 [Dictyobacter vulcani]
MNTTQAPAINCTTANISQSCPRISVQEERAHFAVVWNLVPGNKAQAKEQLVLAQVSFVSLLARRFAVAYRMDYDDLFQYGCRILLERLEHVPVDHPAPSKWLYRCVQGKFIDLLYEDERDYQTVSLDRLVPSQDGHEGLTFGDLLIDTQENTEARHDRLDHRSAVLQEAIYRDLTHHQQEAIALYFDIPGFVPRPNPHKKDRQRLARSSPSTVLMTRRKHAYKILRQDLELQSLLWEGASA